MSKTQLHGKLCENNAQKGVKGIQKSIDRKNYLINQCHQVIIYSLYAFISKSTKSVDNNRIKSC